MQIVCIFALAFLVNLSKGFDCPIEKDGYFLINQKCYFFEGAEKPFIDAQDNCNKKFGDDGGQLFGAQRSKHK